MKRKIKLLTFISLGVVASVGTVTSCSTSWAHWKSRSGGDSKFDFHNDTALPKQWKVRDLLTDLVPNSWDEKTNTLNISYLNNQYELYAMIGYITQIKQASMERIDNYWQYTDPKGGNISWDGLKTYINNLNSLSVINIEENGKLYGNISIDLTKAKSTLLNGFSNYKPTIDPDKGKGIAHKDFHVERAYDVGWNGLTTNGTPHDFMQVARIGMSLTSIPTVGALLKIDSEFALSLSKLVNIPKDSFLGFTDFMGKMDKFFDNFLSNPGFNNWIKVNNVDFRVSPTGKIDNNAPPMFTSFKGYIIIEMLKK